MAIFENARVAQPQAESELIKAVEEGIVELDRVLNVEPSNRTLTDLITQVKTLKQISEPAQADAQAAAHYAGQAAIKDQIVEWSEQIALNVAKNAGVAPQLCFPHIYLGLSDILLSPTTSEPKPVAPNLEQALWAAVTRLERHESTQEERFAAADGLRALLAAAPQPQEVNKC